MADPEAIALLKSIDASLKALLAAHRGGGGNALVASDADLDGPHGDPVIVAKDPRDWHGEPMKGKRLSQCPEDYLSLLADRYDYFAGKETDDKKRGYNLKDAARARGWAARIRSGWKPAVSADEDEPSFDGRW